MKRGILYVLALSHRIFLSLTPAHSLERYLPSRQGSGSILAPNQGSDTARMESSTLSFVLPLKRSLMATCVLLAGTTCATSPGQSNRRAALVPEQVVSASAAKEEIVFKAVGDIMLGSTYPPERGLPADDGAKMLAHVAPLLSAADVTFGNLEGPLIDGGTTSKCGPRSRLCFAFRVPTRYGRYLKEAGFDVMSLANNHASDFGAEGRESSERVLDGLGIAHAGGDINDIAYLTVEGRRIGVIAFATNQISYNVNDVDTAKRAVAKVAATSDIVVVSFHGGAEGASAQHVPRGAETFLDAPRGNLRLFTHAVVDAGADLVLGHGPHVVRGMEVYKDRLIAYSLGNFAFYRFPFAGPTGLSLILEVQIGPDGRFLGGLQRPAGLSRL